MLPRMRVYLVVSERFEAAHWIPEHPKCGKIHGHSYEVEATFSIDKPELTYYTELLIDIAELRKVLKELTSEFDHSLLNDHFELPSIENLAIYFFKMLALKAPCVIERVKVKAGREVAIVESEGE